MAKGHPRILDDKPILYTIEDKIFGKLEVLNSANAWWIDRRKVEDLIQAAKIDASLEESRAYAGISKGEYDYFIQKHPYFSEIKEACNQIPNLKARQTIVKALDDPNHAFKYLEKKRRKEFGQSIDVTSGDKPIPILNVVLTNDSNQEDISSQEEN